MGQKAETKPEFKPTHQMVVKVQSPLYTSGEAHYLVYNEEKTLASQVCVGILPPLDEAMKGYVKRFFGASVVKGESGWILAINPYEPVDDPGW